MRILPIISSIFLIGSLAAADDSTQFISLEVPVMVSTGATLRIVVRNESGAEVAVSEPLVVDVQTLDGAQRLATITVGAGKSSAQVTVVGSQVADEIERSLVHGLIRVGDTGLHACEVLPTPAAAAVAN